MERRVQVIIVVALLIMGTVAEFWEITNLQQQLETQQSVGASLRQELMDAIDDIQENVCRQGPPATIPPGYLLRFGDATAVPVSSPYEGWVVTVVGSNPSNQSDPVRQIDLVSEQTPSGYLPISWSLVVNGTPGYGAILGGTSFMITFGVGGIAIPQGLNSQLATVYLTMTDGWYEVNVTLPPPA